MDAPPRFRFDTVRGIVFDLDGTLVDSYRAITTSLNHARAAHGLPPLSVDTVRGRVGHGLEVLVGELVGPHLVTSAVDMFRQRYAEVYAAETVPLEGAREVVRALARRGYRMAVASNKPARFSDAILESLSMRDDFAAVQGPDRAGVTKPDPAMIELCLAAMEIRAHEALYVGDMPLDVESARRAHVAVALVPGGSSSRQELEATGQLVLDSLGQLLHLLPSLDGARLVPAERP